MCQDLTLGAALQLLRSAAKLPANLAKRGAAPFLRVLQRRKEKLQCSWSLVQVEEEVCLINEWTKPRHPAPSARGLGAEDLPRAFCDPVSLLLDSRPIAVASPLLQCALSDGCVDFSLDPSRG